MKKRLEIPLFVAVAVLLAVGAACDKSGGAASSASAEAADSSRAESPRVVASDDLPEHPETIVSLAPNVTEVLFALDVGDRVAGVTRFCDYPSEVEELPKVGGFTDLDYEAILSLEPDLIVGTISGNDRDIQRELDQTDVGYLFVRMDDLEETYAGIERIGRAVGRADVATELADQMRGQIESVDEEEDGEERPLVLMVYGRDPIVAAGPGTFGHELLEKAGGRNIMTAETNVSTKYPKLDVEKVLELDPQVIIDTSMAPSGRDNVFWREYGSLTAVEDDRVSYLTDPVILRPGPRLPEGVEQIARAIHPH